MRTALLIADGCGRIAARRVWQARERPRCSDHRDGERRRRGGGSASATRSCRPIPPPKVPRRLPIDEEPMDVSTLRLPQSDDTEPEPVK